MYDYSIKIRLIILVVVAHYIHSNENSNIFLLQVLELNPTFILKGFHEYLYISVCIWYDEDSSTQIKRSNANEATLRAVHVFMSSFSKTCQYKQSLFKTFILGIL